MAVLYTNNAVSALSASITSTATSFSVTAGHGVRFPVLSGADYFYVTLSDNAGNIEIVKATARATDTFTVVRAQDGTSGLAFTAADRVELRVTKAVLDDIKTDTKGSLTAGNVTTALGFTPYNATNPSGYTNNTGTVTSVSGTGTVSGLTLSGTVTGSGSLTLGGAIGTLNQNTTGNAATATTAATANALNTANSYTGITFIASGGRSSFTAVSEPFAVGAKYISTGGSVYFGASDGTATPGIQLSFATGAAALSISTAGVVTGTSFSGAGTGLTGTASSLNIGGNAATATLAANSTLAGGLAIASGVNSSANQIVRTNGSGYCDFGWINTVSGTAAGTPARVYCSEDAYIRYYSMSTFTGYVQAAASGTWGINITGSAGSANILGTTRNINGTGFNGSANIDTTEWFHSDRDFPSGTLITTNINYAVTSGDPFVLEIRGNSYGNIVPLDMLYQGYIYSDTIINHGGISNGLNITGLVAINNGGNLCFWFPTQGYWNGYNVKVYTAYATRATNRVTSITGTGKPTTAKEVALTANIRQSLHSGNYNSYAPTLTGTGASGTWGISVTGNATNVTGTVAVANGGTGQTTGYKLFEATYTSNINVNTDRTAGMYGSYASSATNAPTNSGILYNFMSGTGGAGDGGQFWQDYGSDNLYVRKRWGGAFNGWWAVLSPSNVSSYALPLSGGTVTARVNMFDEVIKQYLYVRHIEGKNWDTYDTTGTPLYLNYQNNQAVYIGSSAHLVLHAGNYNSYALPLSGGTVSGNITFSGAVGLRITNADIRSDATSNWTGDPGAQGKIQYHANRWYIVADSSSDRIVQFRRNGTDLSYIDNSGIFQGTSTTIANNSGTVGNATPLRLQHPGGGAYATSSSSVTGAIKIRMPFPVPAYGMWKMVVRIYEYGARGNGYTIELGCHLYPTYAHNRYQWMLTTTSGGVLPVRYGNDGTYSCVWIGDNATTWSYPQIFISEFDGGYNNTSASSWQTGWVISIGAIDNSGAVDGPYTTDLIAAATVGGFTPSTGSGVGSRVVVADGNGYIFNNYFNSTDNAISSGVTAMMSKQGDNYYRSASAAAVATFISGQAMNISGSSTSCSGNAATATNVGGLVANSYTSYGGSATTNAPGGYYGLLFGTSTSHTQAMFDGSGNGGFYRQGSGVWIQYYLVSNNSLGIMTSTTSASYALYVAGSIYATANVTAYSDRRAKKDIETIDNALDKTKRLRGVYYRAIEEQVHDTAHHGKRLMGVIAQEVLEVVPEVVTYDKENDKYGVSYANMVGLLIEAVKELSDKVTEQDARIVRLEALVNQLIGD